MRFIIALLATLIAVANAYSRHYGTTGHYGNQYGHGGNPNHAHADHFYGYDNVEPDVTLKEGGAGRANNEAKLAAILVEVDAANVVRKEYLQFIHDKRVQRLNEIVQQNTREIVAPFDYQLKLLDREEDDIQNALTAASDDAEDAFFNLKERLRELHDDNVAKLDKEITQIKDAIARTEIDQKEACHTLAAMRLDIAKDIECDSTVPSATYNAIDDRQFHIYEGLYDNFHYDIGHGKGTGEGKVDDKKKGRHLKDIDYGDYEID